MINGITNVGADHRTLAVRPAVREVRDPEKGNCLEMAIESNTNHHRLMQEYAVLMLKDPIALPPDAHTVGLWVKGNSGWGHVAWILKDAAGRTYASRSGSVGDFTGRASIDFDGWCFLSQPATAASPIPELSTGGLSHLWGGTAKPPFQLAGLAFCAPAHPLYINEYKARPQSIRIKDVSVLSGP